MRHSIELPTEQTSEQFAIKLADCLQYLAWEAAPFVMTWQGEIGAGKTTIIRAMLRHLGVTSTIKSPTFSLIESYKTPHFECHHFDLYRIHHEMELENIGFRDYFSGRVVCCIEWPERAGESLEHVDLAFEIMLQGAGRQVYMDALSTQGMVVKSNLLGEGT